LSSSALSPSSRWLEAASTPDDAVVDDDGSDSKEDAVLAKVDARRSSGTSSVAADVSPESRARLCAGVDDGEEGSGVAMMAKFVRRAEVIDSDAAQREDGDDDEDEAVDVWPPPR
jgi:hypothetical protein